MSEIRYVRIGDLRIDPSYQRTDKLNKKIVDSIANNFDPKLVGVIKINEREDGSLWVVDGMHRYFGCQAGFGSNYLIRAEVEEGMTPNEEARLFVGQTKRTSISAYHQHRARAASGDEMAVTINSIAAEYGISILNGTSNNQRGIRSIRMLESIYQRFGTEILRKTLAVISESGIASRGVPVPGDIVCGVAEVIRWYGDAVDLGRLAIKLRSAEVEMIKRDIAAAHRLGIGGQNRSAAQGVVSLYNRGLREASKLPAVNELRGSSK